MAKNKVSSHTFLSSNIFLKDYCKILFNYSIKTTDWWDAKKVETTVISVFYYTLVTFDPSSTSQYSCTLRKV